MSVARIYAIALNTFREAVRDRVLYGVLGLATGVLAFTLALAELSLDQQDRVITDLGMASISIFSVVVAIFLGSSLLYKEIERKTLYVILPKPIRRHEFLLGKYFGIVLTCAVFVLLMGAIQLWVMAIQANASIGKLVAVPAVLIVVLALALWKVHDRTVVLVPWAVIALAAGAWVCTTADVDLVPLVAALALNLGEVSILTAIALLFSSFSTPFLTGAFTFGVWLVGRAADSMITMKSSMLAEELKEMLSWLAEIVPNFNLFVPGRNTLVGYSQEYGGVWLYVATSLGYALLYTAIVLVFASLIFRRRDFL